VGHRVSSSTVFGFFLIIAHERRYPADMRLSTKPFLCALAVAAAPLLITFAGSAEAATDRWTPIGVGTANVQGIAVDPAAPGVVYVAAGEPGVFRSADGGESWVWRGLATPSAQLWTNVVVPEAAPSHLYATTRPRNVGPGGLYLSTDGGLHWRLLLSRRFGFNAVAESADGTLLASGELAEVYRSTDGGATWSLVLTPVFGGGGVQLQLAFDPLAPQNAYVGTHSGLWRSSDGGATWQKTGTLPDGQPLDDVTALAFPGTAPGFLYALRLSRLYRSHDGGLTWTGGLLLAGGAVVLAADPADAETVYAAGTKVFVSHDGGDTVTELSSTFPHALFNQVTALAISPASPEVLYAAIPLLGVAVSRDRGRHWSLSQQRGLSARFSFFRPGLSGRLYQQPYQDGSLFRSRDHGASWEMRGTTPSSSVVDLTELAGSPDDLWAADTTSALLHSADGGATWSRTLLPDPLRSNAQAVASPAPGVLLAGGCGIFRSADGGRSWSRVFPCVVGEAGGQAVRLVLRLGTAPGWPGRAWAEVRSSGPESLETLVLFSQDSGRTWRTLWRRPADISGIRRIAAARGLIYLNRDFVLLRSHDQGAHWEVGGGLPAPAVTLAVDAADPDVVVVGTHEGGVFRSTDGGETWTAENAGLARLGRRSIHDVFADPALPSVFYALPETGGIFQIKFQD
jgi:photosystem II stability/assembly factor-like uncharacterized protein